MAGTIGIQDSILIACTVTGDATAGDDYTMTRPGVVLDAWTIATATNGRGTGRVLKNSLNVTDAMAMAANDALTHAATIDSTNYSYVVGDNMKFQTNGAADRGVIVVRYGVPVADSTTV